KPQVHNNPDLVCTLTAEQSVIKLGDIPKFRLNITNKGNKTIYLVNVLDGSGMKQRMPYYYFTIEKPKPDTILFTRCKLMNPLKKEDFIQLEPNQSINPYAVNHQPGLVYDHALSQKETFRNSGIYKINFHYDATATDIKQFMGTIDTENKVDILLMDLFKRIDHYSLTSNTIEIKVISE
ncbi:MAG: hypothetical protein EAZ41_05035, partial [Sphingobacteriia bacterium]